MLKRNRLIYNVRDHKRVSKYVAIATNKAFLLLSAKEITQYLHTQTDSSYKKASIKTPKKKKLQEKNSKQKNSKEKNVDKRSTRNEINQVCS